MMRWLSGEIDRILQLSSIPIDASAILFLKFEDLLLFVLIVTDYYWYVGTQQNPHFLPTKQLRDIAASKVGP